MINLSSGCVTSTVRYIFPVHPPQDPQCDLHNSLRIVPLQHLIHYDLSVIVHQLSFWDGRKASQVRWKLFAWSQFLLKYLQLICAQLLQSGQQQSFSFLLCRFLRKQQQNRLNFNLVTTLSFCQSIGLHDFYQVWVM